jgi:hypothetical protein
MKLVATQANAKKCAFEASSDRIEVIAKSFLLMANAIIDVLLESEKDLRGDHAEQVSSDNQIKIMKEIQQCTRDMRKVFGSNGYVVMTNEHSSFQQTTELMDFTVLNNGGERVTHPAINSTDGWVFLGDADSSPFLEIQLTQPEMLSGVCVQGGKFPSPLGEGREDEEPCSLGCAPRKSSTHLCFSALPCGLGVDDCDGSIDKTVLALADIISWEKITKKNSPETVHHTLYLTSGLVLKILLIA